MVRVAGLRSNFSLIAGQTLTLHLYDEAAATDNNLIERQITPGKLGAKNWLFAGSARRWR